MDETLHTFIAVGCMIGAYWWGKYSAGNSRENLLTNMLDKLEKDGFIATKTDENGDKELVPISEVIAKTLKEYKKAS